MASPFLSILISLFLSLLVSLILFGLSFPFSSNSSTYPEKLSAYKCGFDPFGDARSRFDIRFIIALILFIIPEFTFSFPTMAFADGIGGMDRPPTPPTLELPGAAVEAPADDLEPTPPIVPELGQPLLADSQRRAELYPRLYINTLGQQITEETLQAIVEVQVLIERRVEAALVYDGFDPNRIVENRHHIRGVVFYPRGNAFSLETYRQYMSHIDTLGTRDTRFYQRILNAIRRYDIFL